MEESVDSLMSEIRGRLELIGSSLPSRVDAMAISPTAKLPFKALSYREGLIWRMTELSRSAFEGFENGKMASAILLTRAAVETSAALWYLRAKVSAAVESRAVGSIDDYLMRMLLGSKTIPEMPQPINVLTFVDRVDKDIEGFRRHYDELSEFAHPNWSGTAGLYSKVDRENFWTDFGSHLCDHGGLKYACVINLSVALEMFETTYNDLADLMPAFIRLCEAELAAK